MVIKEAMGGGLSTYSSTAGLELLTEVVSKGVGVGLPAVTGIPRSAIAWSMNSHAVLKSPLSKAVPAMSERPAKPKSSPWV
jgi:hypothetical protein